ncbi:MULTISPECIES: hypothetical protein [Sinobaca]|uniref:Uncharacterized protein n=1 Tax=Sinobaca qinghaiensis TaxID=342944 RepID=A0A419V0A6_9BACL|nr:MULTISPECIES: hypothetical protein [Sinobaca]RKD71300.1 hypothetical protein ATL39_2696 [Sinobaca qinghaiensis]
MTTKPFQLKLAVMIAGIACALVYSNVLYIAAVFFINAWIDFSYSRKKRNTDK